MSNHASNERTADGSWPVADHRGPPTGTAAAAELGQIVDDVESFLQLWMTRLEEVLNRCGTNQGAAELDARIAEFEETQQRWQLRRQRDLQQMQETSEQLSAAWDRIEQEQRRLLHSQDERVSPSPAGVPDPLPAKSLRPESPTSDVFRIERAKPHGAAPLGHPRPAESAKTAATSDAPAPAAPLTRDAAIRQFQQLRRQMGA